MNMFDGGRQKALKELLEALDKGIDLLGNETLDKDLYEAFEKYASSTIKMVHEAYRHNYISYFSGSYMPYSYSGNFNPFSATHTPVPHSAMSAMMTHSSQFNTIEYKAKLRLLLQELIILAKKVANE